MSDIERLVAKLESVHNEVDMLSDAKKTEVKRRYMVLHSTILNLYAVEKRQKQFREEVQQKKKTHSKTVIAVLIAYFFALYFLDLGENKTTLSILFFIWMFHIWTTSEISDSHIRQTANQYMIETTRLRHVVSSLTCMDGHLTNDLLKIQEGYETEESINDELKQKNIQWQIDAWGYLIKEV